MKKTSKRFIPVFLLYCFAMPFILAQKPEVEFLFGHAQTSVSFEHPTEVITEDEGPTFNHGSNSQIGIALSAPVIKSNLYLRSQIGFTSAEGLYKLEYDIDVGQGPLKQRVWTWYSNKRLFMSLTPEFRFNIDLSEDSDFSSQFHIKVNGGLLLHSDIVNSSDAVTGGGYDDLLPSVNGELVEGFTFGFGIAMDAKNIGASLNFSYYRFGASELFSRFDPSIIYKQAVFSVGVYYVL